MRIRTLHGGGPRLGSQTGESYIRVLFLSCSVLFFFSQPPAARGVGARHLKEVSSHLKASPELLRGSFGSKSPADFPLRHLTKIMC